MPLIVLDKQDIFTLLGKSFPDEVLSHNISMMGTDLKSVHDTIEVEIFPDRPDMLSAEGFAMALEGYLGLQTGMPHFTLRSSGYTAAIDERVEKVRPYAVCAIVKGVELSDEAVKSLMQVQEKLHITHGRNRKKVAIGVHDLDKIDFPVTYTTRPTDFSFIPLEGCGELTLREILATHKKGIEYAHLLSPYEEYPLWIDRKGTVLSMPPIINSEDTKVEPGTTNLFLDVTGYSRKALEQALNILVCSLARRGGEIYSIRVTEQKKEYVYPNLTPQEMQVDLAYANTWLGLTLTWEDVRALLGRMRYEVEGDTVSIPPYRADILHPVDIIEDIAKAYGIDQIKEVIPEISTIGEEDPLEVFSRKIAYLLAGCGLLEVKNYYLTSRQFFEKTRIDEEFVHVENAVTEELTMLRSWLLPEMLYTLSLNKHYEYPQNIFEIGEVVYPALTPEKTREELHAGVVICHPRASFTEAKEVLKVLFTNVGKTCTLQETTHPAFIPGRCGALLSAGARVGIVGEIHPDVLTAWELEVPAACFELDLQKIYLSES